MTTEEETEFNRIKTERDALQAIVERAQQRELEADRVIQLLLLAGHAEEDRVAQARELARL